MTCRRTFTLLEIILVCALLALAATFTALPAKRALIRYQSHAECKRLHNIIDNCRYFALIYHADIRLVLHPTPQGLMLTLTTFEPPLKKVLPHTVTFRHLTLNADTPLHFTPMGFIFGPTELHISAAEGESVKIDLRGFITSQLVENGVN